MTTQAADPSCEAKAAEKHLAGTAKASFKTKRVAGASNVVPDARIRVAHPVLNRGVAEDEPAELRWATGSHAVATATRPAGPLAANRRWRPALRAPRTV